MDAEIDKGRVKKMHRNKVLQQVFERGAGSNQFQRALDRKVCFGASVHAVCDDVDLDEQIKWKERRGDRGHRK
jgi:hypothetical protein